MFEPSARGYCGYCGYKRLVDSHIFVDTDEMAEKYVDGSDRPDRYFMKEFVFLLVGIKVVTGQLLQGYLLVSRLLLVSWCKATCWYRLLLVSCSKAAYRYRLLLISCSKATCWYRLLLVSYSKATCSYRSFLVSCSKATC